MSGHSKNSKKDVLNLRDVGKVNFESYRMIRLYEVIDHNENYYRPTP